MSAASETRIFGVRLGVNPKWLVVGLAIMAALMFWYNSRGDEQPAPSAAVPQARFDAASVPAPTSAARARVVRRNRAVLSDRGTLRIRPIDATRGDVDPTLRLELLSRLQSVELGRAGRSLFEIGPQETVVVPELPKGPTIPLPPPIQQVSQPVAQPAAVVNIPLKFYGFVRPALKGENNRGLFLDGDNILIASEGELLNHRYLIVELNANSARLEDTQVKQGQTLPVVPQATSSGSGQNTLQ